MKDTAEAKASAVVTAPPLLETVVSLGGSGVTSAEDLTKALNEWQDFLERNAELEQMADLTKLRRGP